MSGRQFGVCLTDNGASFRLWAPAAQHVDLLLEKPRPMQRVGDGWYCLEVAGAGAGVRYNYRIDGEIDVPDPASAFQPEDVFGPSELIDHDGFEWRARDWRSRPWVETVLIETHVGTFTQAGSYRAMIDKLDHLAATGVTALELMPLADFAGTRGWGYDGVLWYAPDSAYGRPDELKTLIDEAHLRGLMVFLDVVYNHFGPEGNFLHRYAPAFFTAAHTPWGGSAINYRVPQVRAFAIESALSWLRDYRFDGLRLDAVNHIVAAPGEISMLHDLSVAVGQLATETGRQIHIVIENGNNVASLLDPAENPPRGKYRAQWNDDYHHAFHVLLTGESRGYYGDFQRSPIGDIARALGSGFIYQGEFAAFWSRRRGEPSGRLPPTAFINFLQNHDQIGNRALGDRLEGLADGKSIEAALAITLLAPMIPLLFMGEEWGSKVPFPFFCDFEGGLAEAVRAGRRREYGWAYEKHGDDVPDPLDPATFLSARLDWEVRESGGCRERLALVRKLLSIRNREIVPRLEGAVFGLAHGRDDGLLAAHWRLGDGATLLLSANLSGAEITQPATKLKATPIWGGEPSGILPPWSVFWQIAENNGLGSD
jgi:maltooligosyltrehalose trehalohydrolase